MKDILTHTEVESKIILVRDTKVILDSDVAALYGVETKRVNEAVKNNPDKFPDGYVIQLSTDEWKILKSKFSSSFSAGGKVKTPAAFTEKGLYMLATILKSNKATATTLSIIETFATLKELGRNINSITSAKDAETQEKLIGHSGELLSNLIGDELTVKDTETTIELNFAVVKLKHTIKRK
jgi:hypothetical protein